MLAVGDDAAQAHTESKFKPKATSWAGARGLMQI
ncbi:MAG: transglycosylase SLT domain-containing protein, partial [Eggerthellaceae bacterium]|nr:transglycosylase SLT domain-containing protein [Eggerthellaceae bacterium]